MIDLGQELRGAFRFITERRSSLRQPDEWLIDWASGGRQTHSGQRVNANTALGFMAYFAAIDTIARDISMTPRKVNKHLQPRGREPQPKHRVQRILDDPNPDMAAISFWQTITAHALGWRGGFAEIVTDGTGKPVQLWPLNPNNVMPQRDDAGNLEYRVMPTNTKLPASKVFHIHGLGMDGITSFVASSLGKERIGASLGAQEAQAAFFGNGMMPSGVFTVPEHLTKEAFDRLSTQLAKRYGGSGNTGKPIVAEGGATFGPTSVDPKASQLIESTEFNVEDVCRLFDIDPALIGHHKHSTFSNITELMRRYLRKTLLWWFVAIEQECNRKLFLESERGTFFVKHNTNAFLRGSPAEQAAYYASRQRNGTLNQNEVKALEDENGIGKVGDIYYLEGNLIPSEIAVDGPQWVQDPDDPASTPPPGESDEDRAARVGRAVDLMLLAHEPLIRGVYRSVLNTQADKVPRAAKKEAFDDWADEFYEKHRGVALGKLQDVLYPLACSVFSAVQGNVPDMVRSTTNDMGAAMADRYVKGSREDVEDTSNGGWDFGEKRVDRVMREEMDALRAALIELLANGGKTNAAI